MKKFYTTEFWKLMKICAAQGFIAFMICGVAVAHDNYAQLLDREVTLDVREVSFDQALQEVARVSNAYFSYSPELVKINEKITIKVDKQTLRKVLDELLAPRDIRYAVDPDDVTISLKPSSDNKHRVAVRSTKIVDMTDKSSTITGTVTDANGQPIAGVNVLVKGSTNGTTSDAQGNFSIEAEDSDILIFSFIGYTSQEIKVGNQTTIQVSLVEDIKNLGEVVVNAGYWEVKEKEQTGSISRVTSAQIQKQPVNNPLQALQGRMTGVYIQQNTGVPGGGFSIQVRGQNSLRNGANGSTNGNLPLYLVDGIPFTSSSLTSSSISAGNLRGGNPLSSINPSDIESIEVLKDADATSIYGSRGANGVVLITTKRAKAGKATLDVDIGGGIGKVTRMMDLLSTSQYMRMRKEAIENDGLTSLIGDPEFDPYWPDVSLWDSTRNTNWQKKLIGGTVEIPSNETTLFRLNVTTIFRVKVTTFFAAN